MTPYRYLLEQVPLQYWVDALPGRIRKWLVEQVEASSDYHGYTSRLNRRNGVFDSPCGDYRVSMWCVDACNSKFALSVWSIGSSCDAQILPQVDVTDVLEGKDWWLEYATRPREEAPLLWEMVPTTPEISLAVVRIRRFNIIERVCPPTPLPPSTPYLYLVRVAVDYGVDPVVPG